MRTCRKTSIFASSSKPASEDRPNIGENIIDTIGWFFEHPKSVFALDEPSVSISNVKNWCRARVAACRENPLQQLDPSLLIFDGLMR
jgi:hypothetical protein